MGKGYPEGLSTSLCNLGSISPSQRRHGERGHALGRCKRRARKRGMRRSIRSFVQLNHH